MERQDLGYVLDKLYSRQRPDKLVGFEQEKKSLYDMLEASVTLRRGDSCMVVGPRNSGKTMLVDTCLERLEENYGGQFSLIRLHGLLHPEDKAAFREMARQLDRLTGGDLEESLNIENVSLSTTLQELFGLFGRAEVEAYQEGPSRVSVIFVLEDMDRFAGVSRQSLLYNLLDLTKSSNLGVAVVGTTARFTTQEALEKRVRSRFGSLMVSTTRSQTREAFEELAYSLLECPSNPKWNEQVQKAIGGSLKSVIDYIYYTSKDPRELGTSLAPIVYKHHGDILEGKDVELEASPYNIISSTETRIRNLCELDWAILICACRSAVRYATDEVNFALVYREYLDMASELNKNRAGSYNHSGYRVWSAKAARLAWERLESAAVFSRPPAAALTHRDLAAVRIDTSLDELRTLVPVDHPLYGWTRL